KRDEYWIGHEFRIRPARLRRLDFYRDRAGNKPLCVKVTVNGPSVASSIEHGVRQPEPSDAVAFAPCGLEFKWMVAPTNLRSEAAGIALDDGGSGTTSCTMVDLGDLGSAAA